MTKIRRIFSLFLVALMIFTSVPVSVFASPADEPESTPVQETADVGTVGEPAQDADEEPEYAPGNEYRIDGVRYVISAEETVTAYGTSEVPERVEVRAYLGQYPVTKVSGFGRCKTLKEIIIPETVTSITGLYGTGLEKAEIKASYVSVGRNVFGGSPLYENKENWKDGLFIIDGCLIKSEAEGEVILGEEITSIAEGCFGYDGKADTIRIYNPDCKIPNISDTFPPKCLICGHEGSTAQKFVKSFSGWGWRFEKLCVCFDATVVEATESRCDGTVGYTRGFWCDRCQVWQSGHRKSETVTHFDENGDRICDFCETPLDETVIDSGIAGENAFWELNDEGTFRFYGTGALDTYDYQSDIPWLTYVNSGKIKKVVVCKGIKTVLGSYFQSCKSLESVVLSDTVEKISGAFSGCTALREVVLPDSLTVIGDSCFSGCTALESVVIPKNVKIVGSYAFFSCTSLSSVTFTGNTERILMQAFARCEKLAQITLPDSVTNIERYAFCLCTGLTGITLPSELQTIGYSAFEGCTALTAVTIPGKVESIGDRAFKGCTLLSDVRFEKGYVKLDHDVFIDTAAYTDPDNIKDGILYLDGCLIKEVKPGTVNLVLDETVTCIAAGWYNLNTKIKEITIYNPNLQCLYVSPFFPNDTVIKGTLNSTAQELAKKQGYPFVLFCNCDDTVTVPESFGSCDGKTGYTEGVWCERCQLWVTGHEKKYEFTHIDENEDESCDYCRLPVEETVIDAGDCGENIRWYLTDGATLCLVGSGEMASYDNDTKTETPLPDWYEYARDGKIEKVIFSDSITSVGDYAFFDCKSLRSVTVPPILLTIGDSAFRNCENLTEISLPETVYSISHYAFYGCKNLSEIVLSDQLTMLGGYAFSGCAIKSAVIPEKVTVLWEGVFAGCYQLETVEIRSDITKLPDEMFKNCISLSQITMKKSCTAVGAYAFSYCSSLTAFPTEKVITFGKYAFSRCTALTAFRGDSMKELPEGLLANCSALTTVTLSETITAIPKNAFIGCSALTSITVPGKVKSVGESAFENCTALRSVTLPESTSSVSMRAFCGCEKLETVTFLYDKVIVSAPVTVSNERLLTLPQQVTVIARIGSAADLYADQYELNFKPLTEKTIASVTLAKQPDQTVYLCGTDNTLSASGAIVCVQYEDGTTVNYQKRYTVDRKDTDLSKTGVYHPVLCYGEYELAFEITVAENNSVVGIPESRAFNLYCKKGEWASWCFIPAETRRYTFSFDNATDLEIKENYSCVDSYHSAKVISRVYEQGKPYYFLVLSKKENRNVRITEIDKVHFSLLPDGTYEAKCCVAGGDITVPAQFGGVPVTKIADGFLYYQSRSDIKSVTVSEGITEVGEKAFMNFVKPVTLPTTITKIGSSAFFGCKISGTLELSENMKSVGGYAFYGCDSITKLVVRSESTTFGYKAFALCSALETVELPKNSCKLGDYMFSGCTKLQTVTGADAIRTVPTGAFYGCTALTGDKLISDAEKIGDYAFYSCQQLRFARLNDNLTRVGKYSFYNCDGLEELTLGRNVTSIEKNAFSSCNNLKKLAFNDKLKSIGEAAFSNTAITELVLPDTLETLSRQCFNSCQSLERVVLPEKLTAVAESCFSGCASLQSVTAKGRIDEVKGYAFINCAKLTEINFWETLTTVGSLAFKGCVSLKSAPFAIIRYINNNAFEGCTSLKTVNLPATQVLFNTAAFKGCTSLTEMTIPEYSTVSDRAFEDCTSLEKITVMNWVELDENILNNCTALREIYLYTGFDTALNLGTISENVKIYGYPGSSAEKIAREKGYEFCPVDGHVHDFTVSVSEPKQCQSPAYYVYRCDCGYSYTKRIAGTEKQHHYADFTVDKEPTCLKPGVKSKHCFCGQTRTDVTVIEPFGHTEVIDIPAVAPTKTTPGYTHQSHCSVCGETVVKREKIDPLEYDVEVGEDKVTAEKLDAATTKADGAHIFITFTTRNNVCASQVDKTVIYKVGEVKLTKTRLVYNGKTQKPSVIVKDSVGEVLTSGRDYKVAYTADSKYPGRFTVKVTFVGNYSGNKTLSYDIVIDKINPAFASSTTSSVTLSWKPANPDVVYRVYYADGKGNYRKMGETKKTSFTVSSLKAGNEYRFCVRAYVKDKDGKVYWGELGNNVLCAANPAAVTKVSVFQSENSIRLSWNAVNGATGYRIYRYDGKWKIVKDTKSLSCTVSSLKSGTNYTFYVKPYKQISGKTLWSTYNKNYAVKTATKPATPTLQASSPAKGTVALNWTNVSGESGYQVYYAASQNGEYRKLAETGANTAKYSRKLTSGKTYYFKVRAYKKVGSQTVYGSFSAVKSVKVR